MEFESVSILSESHATSPSSQTVRILRPVFKDQYWCHTQVADFFSSVRVWARSGVDLTEDGRLFIQV